MLLSSFFTRSMVFAHIPRAQLLFALLSETFLTIRQNSLNVTVCMIARSSCRGYFIHSLSTLYYYNAPSLATRLTGDYRDRTFTGKCGPASLDTQYKKATENMQRSYSKKAFPWDNACIESFHSIIKREWLNRFKIRDYKQAYQLIFEYLEAFYNTKRIHSHCNYMSPNEFERVYERTHTEAEFLAG